MASPAAREALAGWQARCPAHEAAWTEVAEIHGVAGSVLARPPRDRTVIRRKALALDPGPHCHRGPRA